MWCVEELAFENALLAGWRCIESDYCDLVGLVHFVDGGVGTQSGRIVDGEDSYDIRMDLKNVVGYGEAFVAAPFPFSSVTISSWLPLFLN